MEIMALPNKETLEFFEKITKWIVGDEMTDKGLVFIFKPDTPKDILDRFEEIKDKLPFHKRLAK